MNALVGYKVSIVTHKVQTTRRQIQGVLTKGDSQVVFIDTPGIFDAKKPLEKALVNAAMCINIFIKYGMIFHSRTALSH